MEAEFKIVCRFVLQNQSKVRKMLVKSQGIFLELTADNPVNLHCHDSGNQTESRWPSGVSTGLPPSGPRVLSPETDFRFVNLNVASSI